MHNEIVSAVEKKAAAILAAIAAVEGTWVLVNLQASPRRFWDWTGFTQLSEAGFVGWGLALAVAIRTSVLPPNYRLYAVT